MINAPASSAVVTAGALTVALDCIGTPTFLLHADGRIVHLNAAGTELLRRSVVFRRTNLRLTTRRVTESKLLTAAILRVSESQRPELFRLLNRDGSVRLLVTLTPVPGDSIVAACVADLQAAELGTSKPGTSKSGTSKSGPSSWLQQAFRLSRENAELAEGLISGLSLADFSIERRVTLGAARTRLKKLFAQTGKRSQATLVAALLRAAMIAPPGPR